MASEPVPVMLACAEGEGQPRTCWPVLQGSPTVEMAGPVESASVLLAPEPAPQS